MADLPSGSSDVKGRTRGCSSQARGGRGAQWCQNTAGESVGQAESCVRRLPSSSDFRESRPFPSPEALFVLTFGDLRIFWQSLEPGIIFSAICLAWLPGLSFRSHHNYLCSGSVLAKGTGLLWVGTEGYFVPADEEGRCPSSEPWLQGTDSPRRACSESYLHPSLCQ